MSYNRWMPVQYSPELYHHGVKGMRWGVRRYQPYSDGSFGREGRRIQRARAIAAKGGAKNYQKALNRLDSVMGDADSERQIRAYAGYRKTARLSGKMDKAFDSGKMEKYDKLTDKYSKASKRYEELSGRHAKNYEAAKKLSDDLIKEASSKGYTISSAKTTKLTARGKSLVTSSMLAFGIVPGAVDASISGALHVGTRNRKLRNDGSWNTDYYFKNAGRTYSEQPGANYNPYLYKGNKYSVGSNRRR